MVQCKRSFLRAATWLRLKHAVVQVRSDNSLAGFCNARFALFALPCADAVSALIASDGGTSATSPFGQDPAVNPTSVLYSEAAASNVSQYYNASAGSGEMSVFGFPRGFFSFAWPRMDPGFPVVFPVRLMPRVSRNFAGLHAVR